MIHVKNRKLNRRTVLRGLLGGIPVAIGLPHLEAMLGGSASAATPTAPRRMGVWFWGNGMKIDRWVPTNTGAGWTLSDAMGALAPVQDYVSVVSGMSIKTGNPRGHHAGCVGILSGAPLVEQPHSDSGFRSTFSKPSIDQVAAAIIGTTTKFKSLEVGVSRAVANGEGTTTTYLSHNGPDSPNPAEYDPVKVWDRLFSDIPVSGDPPPMPMVDVSAQLRKSVLDVVQSDLGNLRKRIGTQDQARLDQHLDNVRAIEKRLTTTVTLPPSDVKPPTRPDTISDSTGHEQIEQRNQLMSDQVATAFAMDLTRVASVHFSGSFGSTHYWEANVDTGHHDLTHDESDPQPQVHVCTQFIMAQFAYFVGALKKMPELVDGQTVLDNIAVLASSDVSDGKNHSIDDYPILVAGRGGGDLVYPSVHYRSSGENTSNVLLTVLKAAGTGLTSAGSDGGLSTTSCTPIEAG